MLRSLDLFSGYGGFTLALLPWCRPIAYVEKEEFCQKVLAERMADGSLPRAPLLAEVENVQGVPGICDIITAGFPCQDISIAGNGEGLAGKRSGLYREVVRLTEEIQPRFVLLENVPAIRTKGLFFIATDYAQMGYDARWTTVSAEAIGAPHKRERWFFLAYSNRDKLRVKSRGKRRQNRKKKAKSRVNGQDGAMADTHSKGLQIGQGDESKKKQSRIECKNRTGLPDWQVEPNVGRVSNGSTFRMDRIKALGNGVVPLQARIAFQKLMGLI